MIFNEVESIPGAWVIDLERLDDERGWFARTFSRKEFGERGMVTEFEDSSISFNRRASTLRGMHMQRAPHAEVKLIRCTRGRAYDVMVDARPDSLGFGNWAAFELDPVAGRSVYLPRGVAHGFLTLAEDTELSYQISDSYAPHAVAGFRWDDPAIAIEWPAQPLVVSDRDLSLPTFATLAAQTEEIR